MMPSCWLFALLATAVPTAKALRVPFVGGAGDNAPGCDVELGHMDSVPIGNLKCTGLFTPFHTPGQSS